jgi:predicted lysophospholipase L1 biosynthesis ABC-type transport system permease subunit
VSPEDASRTEAVQAGVFHEQSESLRGTAHHKHVTADEIAPDHLAQQANADVEVGEPPSRLALLLVAVVAVAVLLAAVAVAVAVGGS